MYLVDAIKESKLLATPDVKFLLADAICVDIQNVCDYFATSEKDDWVISRDFPSVIPPFRTAWFEYKIPKRVYEYGGWRDTSENEAGQRIGHLVVHMGEKEKQHEMVINTWSTSKYGVLHLPVVINYSAHPDGTMMQIGENGGEPMYYRMLMNDNMAKIYERLSSKEKGDVIGFMRTLLLAFSFMNCRNVTHTVLRDSPEKLNRRRAKEGKMPITKMYTLRIDGIRKVLASHNEGHDSLTKNALHICRGHFKDFTHGAGLFGKYKGRYWWPMQTRGSVEAGEVVKDYLVKP